MFNIYVDSYGAEPGGISFQKSLIYWTQCSLSFEKNKTKYHFYTSTIIR